MPSMTSVAIQSTLLKTTANLVAQFVAIHKLHTQSSFDPQRVVEFAVFGFIQGHLNYWWQLFLERQFPSPPRGDHVIASASRREKYQAIAAKLLVDQALGLFIGNTNFVICTSIARSESLAALLAVVYDRVPRIIWQAWKLWPAVALVNFLFVPLHYRAVVAIFFGFGWNMFLTFFVHQSG